MKAYLFKKWGNELYQLCDAENYLKDLWAEANYKKISKKSVIIVSFSNSLYRDKYIKLFTQLFDLSVLQLLDVKNITGTPHIILQESVTWDICRLNVPIVYFVDDYRILQNNYFWFTNRNEEDIIFDKNGNLMYGSDSLETNN